MEDKLKVWLLQKPVSPYGCYFFAVAVLSISFLLCISGEVLARQVIQSSDLVGRGELPAQIGTGGNNYIYRLLKARYRPQVGDPKYVESDLREMSRYYSRYPEAVAILTGLTAAEWTMQYDSSRWSTLAKGKNRAIDSITIKFDSRAGVKMSSLHCSQDCSVSPADALLHELLHIQILSGNLAADEINALRNNPGAHELKVIAMERKLYAQMNRRDGRRQPQRNHPSGYLFAVKCPLCTVL